MGLGDEEAMTVTGPQCRAARAMLGWTVRELARRSVVSVATVNAIEDTDVSLTSPG
jgi:hypothetical protein